MIEWHQWYYDNCVCIFVRESGKFPLVCGGDDYLVMLHRDDVTISFDRKNESYMYRKPYLETKL